MRLALLYLFALLCIPFYIGPELAPNAQLNAERLLLALLVALAALGILRGVVGPALSSLASERQLFLALMILFFFWRALAALLSGSTVAIYVYINELISNAFVFVLFYGILLRGNMERHLMRVFSVSIAWILGVVLWELGTGANPFTALASDSTNFAISQATIERAGLLRTKGTFEHPLTLGYFAALLLPIFLFVDRKFVGRRAALFFAAALVFCGAMTGSRSTILLLSAEVSLYLVFRGFRVTSFGRQVNLGLFALPLLPVITIAAVSFAEARAGRDLFDDYVRGAQIHNGFIAIQNAPWFGYGDGRGATNSIANAMRYGDGAMRLWEANLSTIDNWYLSVMLASGFPGAALFIALQLAVLLPSILTILNRDARAVLTRENMLGLYGGLTVALMASNAFMAILSIFTLHPLHYIIQAWLVFLSVRVSRALRQDRADRGDEPLVRPLQRSVPQRPSGGGARWT